jgi:hypothetical protein
MTPTAWDFQNRLMAILNSARQSGQPYVDVESGSLHKQVGGYSDPDHRLRVCCEVMRKLMRAGDSIVKESASDQGATLIVRYACSQPARLSAKTQVE